MSNEDDYTDEEVDAILDAAGDFMSYSMAHMTLGNLAIAGHDERVVNEFVKLYKSLYCAITGVSEEDAGFTVIEESTGDRYGTAEADSASGGSEADPWSKSGKLRPSSRKLH